MDSYLDARADAGQLFHSVYELFPQALYAADPLPPITAKKVYRLQVDIEDEEPEPLETPTFYYNVDVHVSQVIPSEPAPRQPTVDQRREVFVQQNRGEADSEALENMRREVEALRRSESTQREEIEQLKAQNQLLFQQRDPAILQREAEEKRLAEEQQRLAEEAAERQAAEERRRLAELQRQEEERRIRERAEQQLRKAQEALERAKKRDEYYRHFDIDVAVFRYYNPSSMALLDLYRAFKFARSDPALADWSALFEQKLQQRAKPLLVVDTSSHLRQFRRSLDPRYCRLHLTTGLVGKLHHHRNYFLTHRSFPSNVSLADRHRRLAVFWQNDK